jgi:predicted nucleic acid-binding protein
MDKEMGPFVSGCVIDTNILIYHLAGVLTDQAEASLADALESGSYISIITRMELLGWRKHSSDSLKAAETLLPSVSRLRQP